MKFNLHDSIFYPVSTVMKKLLPFIVLLFFNVSAFSQNYQLHSVYIYSFIKYVQWPAEDVEGDFLIGVVGDSPIVEHLQKMASIKKAGSRKIVIKKYNNVAEVQQTHMLFIAKELSNQLPTILKNTGKMHTLLITEEEGMGAEGSNINFVIRKGRLAFEMNKAAMQRASLKVSNELTRLAIVI